LLAGGRLIFIRPLPTAHCLLNWDLVFESFLGFGSIGIW
jgi:hypothetical protein